MSEALQRFVGAFVDELARSGVRHACVCPGSRSTPLALLLRRHSGVHVWTHLDERSASFFALGMAKAMREPVAVVSTSGTAAANFAPAVVEAYYGRTPLVVLTADRPPELRDVGANQTIDQVGLYGKHVRWSVDVPVPDADEDAVRYARTVACRAAAAARGAPAGPVHVNMPFREPLIPSGPAPGAGREGDDMPYTVVRQAPRRPQADELSSLAADLGNARRGLIVCGPQDDAGFPQAVTALAGALRLPVLADPLSQVRCGPHYGPLVIDAYDAFLRDEETAVRLAPDIVLRFGATPTSKPLLQYLQRHARARQALIDEEGWHDPDFVASDIFHVDATAFCEGLLGALASDREQVAVPDDWPGRWRDANEKARSVVTGRMASEAGLSEPGVFAALAGLLPEGAVLFVGNSMPVRDLDAFLPGDSRGLRFMANRGASGIDGVVSTALGSAAVGSAPLVLVVGDVSFYHDMNGLLAARRHELRATIVLLNNDGGGIFNMLPQAEHAEHFEELFGTPHGLDFRHAAAMYGLEYRSGTTRDELREAVLESLGSAGVTLVEVRTDRAENARLHRDLWSDVARALGEPSLPPVRR